MTIIIGIICKDSIILASDSQTTRDGTKRMDAKKITCIKFDNYPVLIAEAGNAGNCSRAIELLRETAKQTKIIDYRQPADMAVKAMTQVKKELQEQFCNWTMTELQDLIRTKELQSEIMLGYYFNNKPFLYVVDLAVTCSDMQTSWCSAIGCGANLGNYLLSEHTERNMDRDLGVALASHIIRTVCKHDAYCSGPPTVGVLVKTIAPFAKGEEPAKKIHPDMIGKGMVLIVSEKPDARYPNQPDKVIESEKKRRNKIIQRHLQKRSEKTITWWKDFTTSRNPKTCKKLAKLFSEAQISSFEIFKA